MEDEIENKSAIYGSYGDQSVVIGKIVAALDELAIANGKKLSEQERAEYTILGLKLTRSVTATGPSRIDSWLDLANYSRLSGLRATGIDCIHDLAKIAKNIKPVEESIPLVGAWRLPTRDELIEAYNSDSDDFKATRYWSSSIIQYNKDRVWTLNFYDGVLNSYNKSDSFPVRCVREEENGSLEWGASALDGMNYSEALLWCEQLNIESSIASRNMIVK